MNLNHIESLAVREVDEIEAKKHFSALLRAVEKGGETILITRNGRGVARLGPVAVAESSQAPRKLSGADLIERFRSLREEAARAKPETDDLT